MTESPQILTYSNTTTGHLLRGRIYWACALLTLAPVVACLPPALQKRNFPPNTVAVISSLYAFSYLVWIACLTTSTVLLRGNIYRSYATAKVTHSAVAWATIAVCALNAIAGMLMVYHNLVNAVRGYYYSNGLWVSLAAMAWTFTLILFLFAAWIFAKKLGRLTGKRIATIAGTVFFLNIFAQLAQFGLIAAVTDFFPRLSKLRTFYFNHVIEWIDPLTLILFTALASTWILIALAVKRSAHQQTVPVA
jgi:hypothetical protein